MNLERRLVKLTAILDVAKAMTVERDLDVLLSLILGEAKQVVEADRCTIFVVDAAKQQLWSRVAQGLTQREIHLPIGKGIAGWVAQQNRVLNISDVYSDDRFDPSIDARTGYRTKAVLCAPMRGARGEVVGVIQALNPNQKDVFDDEDEELILALGGQAAAAIQNVLLHEAIAALFEWMVKASIVAIESRDPVTYGHSERVAKLSVELARAINERESGPYCEINFSNEALRELRYAGLLHDIGKVGVREHILLKSMRLLDSDLERLLLRVELAKKNAEADCWREIAESSATSAAREESLGQLHSRCERLDALADLIQRCTTAPYIDDDTIRVLGELSEIALIDSGAQPEPILTENDLEQLTIRKGTLTSRERLEIESHVLKSFAFLTSIPWTDDLAKIPEIALSHHEKLDGSGYPRSLTDQQISLGARILAITDIYDALTAEDRPYKKAKSHQQAIAILYAEANEGRLDKELVVLFDHASVASRADADNARSFSGCHPKI